MFADRREHKLPINTQRPNATTIPLWNIDPHAFIESFIGRLRDECLNETLFSSVSEARAVLTTWQGDYNGVRPHSALANKAPWEFRAEHVAVAANCINGQDFNPGLSGSSHLNGNDQDRCESDAQAMEIEQHRKRYQRFDHRTWPLFWWQVGTFGAGAVFLTAASVFSPIIERLL